VIHPRAAHLPGVTPQERLAISRRAILQCMARGGHDDGENPQGEAADAAGDAFGPKRPGSLHRLWRALRRTTLIWWRRHPAHLAVEMVQPVLGQYARAHPLTLLGVAATLGAVVVLARPWRLIPVAGLLMAALKSKAFTQFIASALMPEQGRGRQSH
jgi:hypothetical protein